MLYRLSKGQQEEGEREELGALQGRILRQDRQKTMIETVGTTRCFSVRLCDLRLGLHAVSGYQGGRCMGYAGTGGERTTALVKPLTETRKKGWFLSERDTGASAVLARGEMPWRLCDVYQHATTRVALRLNHHCTDGCRLCRRLIACSSRAGPKLVLRYEEVGGL